jgi:hypothetical protein
MLYGRTATIRAESGYGTGSLATVKAQLCYRQDSNNQSRVVTGPGPLRQ